uniref:Uncharacterized protein n=1 Tax=Myoviridae sp. ctOAa14 TaxID=2826646 RepID=A0A8S5MQT3_9CAUD|nr:MAG TPA: hypothetical protein [Myoviridae sp. ctOAa14]
MCSATASTRTNNYRRAFAMTDILFALGHVVGMCVYQYFIG